MPVGKKIILLSFLILMGLSANNLKAQGSFSSGFNQTAKKPKPGIAFLKSLVLPGWGHYYVNKNNWTRGKIQMAADAALIISYLSLNSYTNHLKNDMFTYAATYSGTDIRNKGLQFQLNVASYDSRAQYNDYQERSRNWNQLYPDTQAYYWSWQSDRDRLHYLDMKDKYDRTRQQLPTLITLMVVNRLVSGISAYLRARKADKILPTVAFTIPAQFGTNGVQANITIPF